MYLNEALKIWTRSFLGLLVVGLSVSAQTHHYDITDLGVLPGQPASVASGINGSGQVVGISGNRAFIYHGCGMRDLGSLPGGLIAEAFAINDQGTVVGSSMGSDAAFRAVSWYGGSIHLLQADTFYQSQAFGINGPGKVVGYEYGAGVSYATLYIDGVLYPVPIDFDQQYGGASVSALLGINSSGQMTGYRTIRNSLHEVIQQLGLVTPVGSTSWLRIAPPTGFSQSVAPVAINEDGAVAGTATSTAGVNRAFLSTDPQLTAQNLGTLGGSFSQGKALNNGGWVVGIATTKTGAQAAFLYDGAQLINLNTTLTNGTGWNLISANGINDWGEIVGYGTHSGATRAFLLSPSNVTIRTKPICSISFLGLTQESVAPIDKDFDQ